VVPGCFTVSTIHPGSQYSTCTQGVEGLQKHGPVIAHCTQPILGREAMFTLPLPDALPLAAVAPTATTAPDAVVVVDPDEDFGGGCVGVCTTVVGVQGEVLVRSISRMLLSPRCCPAWTAKRLTV
jgi:hypothetical protein